MRQRKLRMIMADKKPDTKEAAPAEKKPEQVISPEDIAETKTALLDSLWGTGTAERIEPKKAETKEEKKDEAKKDEPAKSASEVAPESKPADAKTEGAADPSKPKPAVKRKGGKKEATPAAEEKPAEVPAQDVEETVRRVLAEAQPQPTPDNRNSGRSDEQIVSDPKDQAILSVLQKMEEKNPQNKGLAKRTVEFWKREESYQTQWEQAEATRAADEGREPADFNPEAREHKAWYARNEPPIDQKEFDAVQDGLKEERHRAAAREEARKEIAPEIQELRRERADKNHAPAIEKSTASAHAAVEDAIPEALMDKDANGDLILTEDTNPLVYDAVTKEKAWLSSVVPELEKLGRMPEHYALDLGKRAHAEIYQTFSDLERAVAAAPPNKQVIDGRRFMSTAAKRDAIGQIEASNGAPQQKQAALSRLENSTWTIQPEDVRERLVKISTGRIAAFSEKALKWQSARKNDGSKNGESATAANGHKPADKTATPPSGATSSVSDIQDNTKKLQDKSASHEEEVVKAMW